MGKIILNAVVVAASFAAMESAAWFSHRYLMHGVFWRLHRDHHQKGHTGFLEQNDFFFLIFAAPGIVCLALGSFTAATFLFYIGTGITLYGVCYFLVHDIFIHRRIKIFSNYNNRYLAGIRRAHKMHHKHLGKQDGECFGMLWVPMKYFAESKARQKKN